MIKMLRFIAILFVFYSISTDTLASTPVNGTLNASQSCEAFVSKNKQTNPDDAKLTIGQSYSVIEANKATNPSWYRLTVPDAHPRERWVAKHCGQIDVQIGGGRNSSGGGNSSDCRTAGLEDSYVLALSWQPAFCETRSGRNKPECQIDNPKSYQAKNFTLHGLWPNKRECGAKYGFCGEINRKPGDFCDYPQLQLFTEIRNELEQVMPSAAAGSCLQRHEWFKHGTCQTTLTIDEYFEVAIDLTSQFNASGIGYFMSRNVGETVTEEALIQRIDCTHGTDTHKSIELKCKNGNLVDVYIYLTDTLEKNTDLKDMLDSTGRGFKSNCGGKFKIDPIGFVN